MAGDFTGDGRTDLAVANYKSNDVSVLLGNGDGTFQNQVRDPVGYGPAALVAGDFTGDGRTDLAVANSSDNDVSVLLGNGDGTFQNQVRDPVGAGPVSIAAGDFNGDGHTDLAIANSGSNDVSVLLGNGDGTFQNQVRNPVGTGPAAIVAGDFTGDGRTDLAIANYSSNDVSVLLGNGDGTFQNQVRNPVGTGPTAIVAGDFNGDGRTDLAVANQDSNDVSVLLGNGDGTFQNAVQYAAGTGAFALVAGDFNGDGRTDLAIANYASNDVSVLLGKGDGTFQNQVRYAAGNTPNALVAGDFNGDGRTDLAVANGGSNDVSVLLGNGDGTFQNQVRYAAGAYPISIVAGDFNGDGRTDLAVANQGSGNSDVSVLLGNGDGTFQNQVRYAAGAYPISIVAGDFNGDGRTDLAVANQGSGNSDVSVLLGNGDGTFQNQVRYAAGALPISVVAGDFNGDGRTDLAVANYKSNDVSVLLSLNGTFTASGPVATNSHATPLVTDLSGKGADDVLVINGAGDILWRKGRSQEPGTFDPPITINRGHPSRDIVAVDTPQGRVLASVDATNNAISLYGWRGGTFVRIGSLPTGSLPAQIVAADLNRDGWDDLVVRNAGDGKLTVFFSNDFGSDPTGNALFPSSVTLPVGLGVSDVTLADVDQDGVLDIIVTNKVSGEVDVLRNLGHGAFAPAVLYRAGDGLYGVTNNTDGSATLTTLEATSGVAAGAFTRGGPSDLVATDPGSNTFSLLKGLGAGRFANPVTVPTASPARAIRVADVDGDGVPDAIILSASGVSVYRGDGREGFLPHPFTIGAGPDPTGLTVADVNHDGKLDLLVGNPFGDVLVLAGQGDGTFRPLLDIGRSIALAVADLTGHGTKDLIYANQGLDRVIVDYGGGQKVVLGDRSKGLLAPGAVTVADLNGDKIPDLIVANSGNNDVLIYPGLGNGQFGPALNGGHGLFTGTDPVGITVVGVTDPDLNGDGRPDLVIANKGSNDVSILLSQKQGNSLTFIPGPRLKAGSGPVSTVVKDINGDGIPDVLVSNSRSNNVILLPGVGGGFFNDQNPRVFPVGNSPGPIFFVNFDGSPGLLTVNSGSNDLTLYSDFTGASPVRSTISSGGLDPVAAFVFRSSDGFDNVIVADNGDGHLALLKGGAEGLILSDILERPELPNPTALALSLFTGEQVEFYAATEGKEAAFLVQIDLSIAPGARPRPVGPASGVVAGAGRHAAGPHD